MRTVQEDQGCLIQILALAVCREKSHSCQESFVYCLLVQGATMGIVEAAPEGKDFLLEQHNLDFRRNSPAGENLHGS